MQTPSSKATQASAVASTTKQQTPAAAKATPPAASTATTTKATKPTRPCVCGCGTLVRRWFAQGHDQRVRGMLQRGETNPTLDAAIRDGLVLREHVEHPPTGRAGAGFRLLVHRTRTAAAKTTKAA